MSQQDNVVPASHQDLLESNALAHIATIGPDGEPQSTPIWFSWDGQYLRFGHTTARQKYRNLKRDPRVAISIVDQTDPYRYIELRGTVKSIENDEGYAFINSLAKKYMGLDVNPFISPSEQYVVITIEPEHSTKMG